MKGITFKSINLEPLVASLLLVLRACVLRVQNGEGLRVGSFPEQPLRMIDLVPNSFLLLVAMANGDLMLRQIFPLSFFISFFLFLS